MRSANIFLCLAALLTSSCTIIPAGYQKLEDDAGSARVEIGGPASRSRSFAESTKPKPDESQRPPVGLLGYPLGSYLRIEGMVPDSTTGLKGRTLYLLVDTVSGHKLTKPVFIYTRRALPQGVRCVFCGYETGAWVGGNPPEVGQFEHFSNTRPKPQAAWHFANEFVITSVVLPSDFKLATLN